MALKSSRTASPIGTSGCTDCAALRHVSIFSATPLEEFGKIHTMGAPGLLIRPFQEMARAISGLNLGRLRRSEERRVGKETTARTKLMCGAQPFSVPARTT